MKDTQKEMQGFFESYAATEDDEVEDELNLLASQMENDQLPKVSEKSAPIIQKAEPSKIVEKNSEDELNEFLAG